MTSRQGEATTTKTPAKEAELEAEMSAGNGHHTPLRHPYRVLKSGSFFLPNAPTLNLFRLAKLPVFDFL